MRIKELYIRRYGPLNDIHLKFEKGIQPIFGENESGKTLIVDCIIKMLTGKTRDLGQQVNRVDEFPEGYLILEDEGEEIKLEKGKSLANYLSIEADEIRNIFVVREADLKIEDEFYEKVTDKITGLRSREIDNIIKMLREFGRLTEANNLSDDQNFKKPKTNKKNAEKLKEDAHNYIEEAEKTGIQDLEAKYFEAKIKCEELTKKIELLKKAEAKENLIDLKRRLENVKQKINTLGKKPNLENILRLKEKIKSYKRIESSKIFVEKGAKNLRLLNIMLLPTLVITWILSNTFGFPLLPELLFITFIFTLIAFFYFEFKLSKIESKERELLGEANALGIDVKTIEELEKELDNQVEEVETLNKNLRENIGILKSALGLDKDLDDLKFIELAGKELEKKEREIDLNVDIKFDKKELDDANKKLEDIRKQIESLEKSLSVHKEKLTEFFNRAKSIDFRTFIGRDLSVQTENLDSLKILEKELDILIQKIEIDAKISKHAIEIFNEIEEEEEEKIKTLFGPESLTSNLFKEITGGRYNNVSYDPNERKIFVYRPTGASFPVDRLSKGAFDQLYMSIRIDLAHKILGDRKGFFVMDDAFISSGPNRFKNIMDIIKHLSDMGWNIIYFTVRKGDAELLSKLSGNNLIVLPTLP